MAPPGPLLWRRLRVHQIYGANTNVGKTIFATFLCKAADHVKTCTDQDKPSTTTFLKPVSTGPLEQADDRHILKFAPSAVRDTLFQYDLAVSPHAAAKGKTIPSDERLLSKIYEYVSKQAAKGSGWLFIETAGGVHSPGPSGSTQADMYMPLRAPVILVGDSKLGGISLTISAFESLHLRGYDVQTILMFQDNEHQNHLHLAEYFHHRYCIPVRTLPRPPAKLSQSENADVQAMDQYYSNPKSLAVVDGVLQALDHRHQARIVRLESMAADAHKRIWFPFTQQQLLQPETITVIDAARGDHFHTLSSRTTASSSTPSVSSPAPSPRDETAPLLRPTFDGSASWWTQGLGHANPSLTLAAAHAAGRYGHVMFAEAVHEPALALAQTLLDKLGNPRLRRVFFSDNGSTGAEVAVKMALRAARMRYGWAATATPKLSVVGLRGGYHGDTMGAMDCAEPGTYNEKVEWYDGSKGFWFDYPTVHSVQGKWFVSVPEDLVPELGSGGQFESLAHVFDLSVRMASDACRRYEAYITATLKRLRHEGRRFGALIIEPVVVGAGGMALVDPLFQRALVNAVRRSSHIFSEDGSDFNPTTPTAWSGLPVIFDEVFTGLYRLGRATAASFLGVDADIAINAKLLTGGLVPLCTTAASETIFEAFASTDKTDALLHGHSYTAHPVGCQVALESLRQLCEMDRLGSWDWARHHGGWAEATLPGWPEGENAGSGGGAGHQPPLVWSVWPRGLVDWISHRTTRVAGVWALGSVLAIRMRSRLGEGNVGYTSMAAVVLRDRLRDADASGFNIHSRVLGNVLYLMTGQTTTQPVIAKVAECIQQAFEALDAWAYRHN